MITVIILLALILATMLFGHVAVAIFAAIGGSIIGVIAAAIVCGAAIIVLAYVVGAFLWCIWWLFDRKGAMASYRAAEAAHQRNEEAKLRAKLKALQ